ncbi:MAG: nucleotide exchange factor GrpE [Bacteriovoracaceae bacterium]|nr:nucleotide exchange factor GrpE [Bacteriovoracaceae bacterium]
MSENEVEAENEEVCAEVQEDNSEEAVVEESAVEDIPKEEAKEEEEDFKSKYYYLAAEMDNMRRRFNREKESLIKYGNEKILSSLIDVIDTFDHSMVAIENDEDEKIQNICKGIDMVRGQFLDALKKNGLESIEAVGEVFDPNFHEAMAQQPAEGKKDQEVIMEYQKGYMLNGRLLRASKVVIAKND